MTGKAIRVFATADIGDAALERLRRRGYEVEVYDEPTAPPQSLIIEKIKRGIDGLIAIPSCTRVSAYGTTWIRSMGGGTSSSVRRPA